MSKYVALRDRRLAGGVPARPKLAIVNTDKTTSLTHAFRAISANAGRGRIDSLFILCHGYAGYNKRARISVDAGGMGLQLGTEEVRHENVAMWTAVRDKVTNIVIYACGAADTQPGNRGTSADGRYLMGALALHTNATVYAADLIQWYDTYKGLENGAYEFGAWEGNLLRFKPDGCSIDRVPRAPTELADVFGGR